MADSSAIFRGNSRYSNDFAQLIDRAVKIASLPLTQLTNQKSAYTDQQTAWTALQAKFSGLRNGLTAIAGVTGDKSFQATSNDIAIARGTASAGVRTGTYSLTVVDIGARTSAVSSSGVANASTTALASASSFTLTANGSSFTIAPSAPTVSALVDAINGQSQAGVRATLVNVASAGQPADYRISLQSTKYNADTIELSYVDDANVTQQLLNAASPGAPVTYRVNGYPADAAPPLQSDSRTIEIAPGLSVDVIKSGTAEITVGRNMTALSSAIASFVNAYNGSVDELDKHRGQSVGALKGQSTVGLLSQTLRDMMKYTGSGSVANMHAIGLSFGKDGKLQFDANVLATMPDSQASDAISFLGDGTSSGLLGQISRSLSGVDDSNHGIVPTELQSIKDQLLSQDKKIAADQDRIDALQTSLTLQMSAADALIASMEQQVNYFTSMFEAMRVSSESYK